MDMIQSTGAPAAIGPYSQAVDTGSTVYLSGQIGQDPASGQIVTGSSRPRPSRLSKT